MSKVKDLEARMNVETFDGEIARVDSNSAGEWYIHRDISPRTGPAMVRYLNRAGEWEAHSIDRWPTMAAAIKFAKTGPSSIEAVFRSILKEAEAFPLAMRIAVKLIDDGYTEMDFAKGKFPLIGQPLLIEVRNHIRDFERKGRPGQMGIAPRLLELARNL